MPRVASCAAFLPYLYTNFRQQMAEASLSKASEQSCPQTSNTTQPPPNPIHPLLLDSDAALIGRVEDFVLVHMNQFDSSHDWDHIERVVALAHRIHDEMVHTSSTTRQYNKTLMHLAALLHDICDHKYLSKTLATTGTTASSSVPQSVTALLHQTLRNPPLLIPTALALPLEEIIMNVSYSSERRDPNKVQQVLSRHPELAIVQDADRLDAIGAVGIGRCFTYGATKAAESKVECSTGKGHANSMVDSLVHFDEKLLNIETMMKTGPGRLMARERTKRLKLFKHWWQEETGIVQFGTVNVSNR